MVEEIVKYDSQICVFHHEHKSRLERSEQDIRNIWEAIDRMRGWVVLGSGSMILCLIGIIVQFIFFFWGKN